MNKSDKRRDYEKYYPGVHTTSKVLFWRCPHISGLVEKLKENLSIHERISIEHWNDEHFHVIVCDCRFLMDASCMRIGFTVNVYKDQIQWRNPYISADDSKANLTFVRDNRWKRFLRENFPSNSVKLVNWYKTVNITDYIKRHPNVYGAKNVS